MKITDGKIRSALRRLWLYSDIRAEAIKRSRVARGEYQCKKCKKKFSRKEIEVNHIHPAGGSKDWHRFINRLLKCKVTQLEVLCKPCHRVNTRSISSKS